MSPPRTRRNASRARSATWPRPWFFVLAGSIALLGQMPAHRVAASITSACAGQCRLAEVSGPWWAGRGELFIKAPASKAWHALGDFAWQSAPAGAGIAELALGRGRIRLRNLDEIWIDGIRLPAEILLAQPHFGLPGSDWQGQLEIGQTRLQRAGRQLGESHGELHWQGAASSLLAGYPLGDYQMHWRWQTGLIAARLSGGRPESIELQAEIGATSGVDREHRLRGHVTVRGAAQAELGRYLHLIGPPASSNAGQFPFDWPLGRRPGP